MIMKNISIWTEEKQNTVCNSLHENLLLDVLIIGGGITGISAAYQLKNSGLNIALVEKNTIGMGVTSKTTGKLTYLQENIYTKIKKYHGLDKAKLYLESQIDAINLVKNIISKENINCDFQKVNSYLYTNYDNEKLIQEINILKELKVKLNYASSLPDKTKVNNAVFIEDSYVFHPLKYLYALKNKCLNSKVRIFENSKVTSIHQENNLYICKIGENFIKAKYVILALHYPYFLIPFWFPLKTSIEKSYIKAFKVSQNDYFNAITISKPITSLRYHSDKNQNYKIELTNSHISCTKYNEQENFNALLKSQNSPDYIWSNMDIMTDDALPFIGAIDKTNTLLIATGYNTWGMTNGSIAGKILADIITKKSNKYLALFNPLRKINIGKMLNFPIVLGCNTCSFIKSKIKKQKPWYPDNVRFEKRNGDNIAIYIDENKKEHIVYNLCPHMKCSLIFNVVEKTWDCPCHGSRFDIDGNSIEGPSNYNITYPKKNL